MVRTICLYGRCVARDIFGIGKIGGVQGDKEGTFDIIKYVASINWLGYPDTNYEIRDKEENLLSMEDFMYHKLFPDRITNFIRRMFYYDLTNTSKDNFFNVRAEWLLIDPSVFWLPWCVTKERIYTYSPYFERCVELFRRYGFIPDKTECRIIRVEDLTEQQLREMFTLLCDRFLQYYDEERIILLETKFTNILFTNEGNITGCYINQSDNLFHEKLFNILKEILPAAHVIEFPEQCRITDGRHKWGKSPLHYIQEFYDYSLEAIDIITQGNNSPQEEKQKLSNLVRKYNDYALKKYEPILIKSLVDYRRNNEEQIREKKESLYIKKLLLNSGKMEGIYRFFLKNRFSHCAFYGASEICRTLIPIFQNRAGICIDYIVEDLKEKTLFDTPVISRNAPSYPATQVMIIADVMSTGKIKEKLKKRNVPYPVYDVYEICEF